MVDEEQSYFCFFKIGSEAELGTMIGLLTLTITLLWVSIRNFLRVRHLHNPAVILIYRLVFAWWTTYAISNVFGMVLFGVKEKLDDEEMSTATKYSFVLDWGNAFIIQALLLYLPYHWAHKITDLFCYINDKNSQIEDGGRVPYNGYETKIYPILKWYLRIRIGFLLLPILFLTIPSDSSEQILFKIMVAVLLLDCLAIVTSLIFGMVSLRTTQQLKMQLDQIQCKRMVNQYLMIIGGSLLRFGFDINYVISKVFGDESFSEICPPINGDLAPQLTFSICQSLFTHFLPIFIVLRVYNVEDKPEEIAKSLIVSGDSDPMGDY